VKFNDADLVGSPVRIVIGDKSLKQGKLEVKSRGSDEILLADMENVVGAVKELLESIN
jgi:prolyl-tRNA synthetase